MAMLDEAKNSTEQVNIDPSIPPAGVSPGSDAENNAFANLEKSRGGWKMGVQSALMGAAMGGKAAEGALSPLAAFVQGAAAGMQAPAMIYQQKREQIQSALDASPFGVTHPGMMKNPDGSPSVWATFSGIPTAIMMKAIPEMATEIMKVHSESAAIQQRGVEERRNLLFQAALKGKDPTNIKDQLEVSKVFQTLDPVVKYNALLQPYQSVMSAESNAPLNDDGTKNLAMADKQMMVGFMRMIAPQIRVNESSTEMLDISSGLDKATVQAWNKIANGQTLTVSERNAIKSAAVGEFSRVQKPYHDVLTHWSQKLAESGGDPESLTATKELTTKYINGIAVLGYMLKDGSFAPVEE